MVIALDKFQFIDEFRKIRPVDFSYEALELLYAYLTELEDDIGQQIDFDPIAFCGDFCEMTARQVCATFNVEINKSNDDDEDCYNEPAREFLASEGLLIGSTGTTFLIRNV